MGKIQCRAGEQVFTFLSYPSASQKGEILVETSDGKSLVVMYQKEIDGITLKLPHGSFSFGVQREKNEEGDFLYTLLRKNSHERFDQVPVTLGEENLVNRSANLKKPKIPKMKAQMPGKIIRLLVTEGAFVPSGAPLLVMEAMKMENQMVAPRDVRVKRILVSVGQAVESGVELLIFDDPE